MLRDGEPNLERIRRLHSARFLDRVHARGVFEVQREVRELVRNRIARAAFGNQVARGVLVDGAIKHIDAIHELGDDHVDRRGWNRRKRGSVVIAPVDIENQVLLAGCSDGEGQRAEIHGRVGGQECPIR